MFVNYLDFDQMVAMDISPEMIDFARINHTLDGKVRYECADITADWEKLREDMKIKEGSVDVVISIYCLHWVSDLQKAIHNFYKMLKPGKLFG